MNTTMKDMLERRSCRNFKADMVPNDFVNTSWQLSFKQFENYAVLSRAS